MKEDVLRILRKVCERQDSFLSTEYGVIEDKVVSYIDLVSSHPDNFYLESIGDSFIIVACLEHDFSTELVASIEHIVSLDNNASRLLRNGENWAKEKGAVFITQSTNYSNSPVYIPLYERKGYTHIGYTFKKNLRR